MSIRKAAAQVVRSVPGEFTHFARNLLLYQQLDPDRRRRPDHLSPDDINKLAIDYSAARIEPQIKYYRDRCARASRAARLFEISSLILSFTAVVTGSVLVFGAERNPELWGFAKLCTATAAPVMVSLLMIHEVKRREARYQEMENALKHFGGKIGHVRSMMALRDMIIDIERMLLSECHDWWVLAKANVAA